MAYSKTTWNNNAAPAISAENLNKMEQGIYDANQTGSTLVAPTFSTSAAYSAGDYVLYSDVLYRFNVDHAAGAWNSSQVTAVKIGDEVTDLKEDLDAISVSFDSTNKKIVIEYN